MLPVTLAGLGYHLPKRVLTSAELERHLGLAAGWCERATGIRERRRAEQETTVGMAVEAARMALEHGGVAPEDIDLVVGAQTGPQQLLPCTAAFVQRALGLPDGGSACFDVNATCLSFLFALDAAARFVDSGAYRTVLVFSSEKSLGHVNPKEPESAVLIGDGAAAAVVTRGGEPGRGVRASRFRTFSSGADLAVYLGGGSLHPPTDPATTPEMYYFHMEGPALFRLAARLLPPFVDEVLAAAGWSRADVDVVVPHQASGPGVRLAWSRCGFDRDKVVVNLETHGNCIAASLPLALAEAVHQGRVRRGDRVLLIGTGAGLTLGAVALTY
jgi:3-oxoacyl-[acyl-carrier-protein] synthase III